MLARIRMLWVTVRDSLWFVPAALTLAAAILALVLIEVEERYGELLASSARLLWDGGPEGTRGMLTAIASSLITVTGVVFSVTIVALQLASSQFTPRLLRNFTADRTNQVVLGVLIGTFTYSLLVLRAVRSGTEAPEVEVFIPRVASTVALILVLVSIAFLIYFIDHASKSIQVSVIIDRVTRLTKQHVEERLPEPAEGEAVPRWVQPDGEPGWVGAAESGYLQAVDETSLVRLCQEKEIWMRMEPHMGQFVLESRPLASVWPGEKIDDQVVRDVRRAFVLGHEPTPEQDIEFGVIEISDIAVKALSPAINDPTTALRCIDRLGEILTMIGRRRGGLPSRHPQDPVRFVADMLDYERVVGLAFDQIRHFGADNPTIGRKLVDLLTQMLTVVPEEQHPPLRSQLEAIIADARRSIRSPIELEGFERMLERHGLNA